MVTMVITLFRALITLLISAHEPPSMSDGRRSASKAMMALARLIHVPANGSEMPNSRTICDMVLS